MSASHHGADRTRRIELPADLRDRLAERISSAEERIRRSKLSVHATIVRVPEPNQPKPDPRRPAA